MGRSEIRSILKWFKYEGRDYIVMVLDRDEEGVGRLKEVPLGRVERITGWAMYLDDGYTVIPLHRVYMVKDRRGRIIWRRGSGSGSGG